jgi:hypothetical protein
MPNINTILLICIIFMYSCGISENESKSETNKSEEVNAELLLELINKDDSINKTTNKSDSDSSKFVHAFENIYFGDQSPVFESIYYLNEIPYTIGASSYREDNGLYGFKLIAQNAYIQSIYPTIKDELIRVISLKYSSGKKYYEKVDGEIDRIISRKYSNDNGVSQPKDWYDIIYLHKWEKNGIVIKLGYKIDYDDKVETKPLFRPILSFLYIPFSKQSKKVIDSLHNEESNKF